MGKTFEELEKRSDDLEKKHEQLKLQYEALMKRVAEVKAEAAILAKDVKEALGEL